MRLETVAVDAHHVGKRGKIMRKRSGLIVWFNDYRAAKNLERYGHLLYVSRRMHYALLYVNEEDGEQVTKQLTNLAFIKKVEPSLRHEIKTEYDSKGPDKSQFFSA